jgi:phosphoribosylformylglycinamidine synthase
VPCNEIGQVIRQPQAHILDGDQGVAQLPIKQLTEAPRYRLKGAPSRVQLDRQRLSLGDIPLPGESVSDTLLRLLASPNIASKRPVFRQYDHQVQTNTVVGPGSDAAVLRVKGTEKAIALCIDCNSRYCFLDPYRGGQIVVAEVCRNLSCAGAEPLALTDCLNFGNPERPDIYHQLEWCIRGMARACRFLGVPVVSGNVSLYNESQGQAIYPTPIVGGLGLLEDVNLRAPSAFPDEGLAVYLLGQSSLRPRTSDLAGSEILRVTHDRVAGRPTISLPLERNVQQLCRQAIHQGIILSAHDCSDGGLGVALAECCVSTAVGFIGGPSLARLPARWDCSLFGERQSRIVVALPVERVEELLGMAADSNIPLLELGRTGGTRLRLGQYADLPLTEVADAWEGALDRTMEL